MKPRSERTKRGRCTFLFRWVQCGRHFFDRIQALKMTASLFRNTETQNESRAWRRRQRKSSSPSRRGKSKRWPETETVLINHYCRAKHRLSNRNGCNVEKTETLPCSMYVMKPRERSTAPRWKLKPCKIREFKCKQCTSDTQHRYKV